jgi:hypothetical protein
VSSCCLAISWCYLLEELRLRVATDLYANVVYMRESIIFRVMSVGTSKVLNLRTLLVPILLILLLVPCERELCTPDGSILLSQVQTAHVGTTALPSVVESCALHCSLIIPLLVETITIGLTTYIPLHSIIFRLRLSLPPLLPPPRHT